MNTQPATESIQIKAPVSESYEFLTTAAYEYID